MEEEIKNYKNIIRKLKNRIKLLEIENKELKEKNHNERGAGRKNKFSQQQKETIKMYRLQNKTIKEIAEIFNCSSGLIHKILHE